MCVQCKPLHEPPEGATDVQLPGPQAEQRLELGIRTNSRHGNTPPLLTAPQGVLIHIVTFFMTLTSLMSNVMCSETLVQRISWFALQSSCALLRKAFSGKAFPIFFLNTCSILLVLDSDECRGNGWVCKKSLLVLSLRLCPVTRP